MGTEVTSCIMMINLVLAITALSLNLVVISFYRTKLNNTVPFIYFILASSDFCTGVCTACHFVTLLIFLVVKAEESACLFWASFFSYFLSIVSFRLSAFISLLFSILRTTNIISPFTPIRKGVVMIVVIIYTTFWSVAFLVELVLYVLNEEERYDPYSSTMFMMSTFYNPAILINIHTEYCKANMYTPIHLHILSLLVTIVPIPVPAIISLVLTSVQIYYLIKMDQQRNTLERGAGARRNKEIEITIVLITLLFFICTSLTLAQPLYWIDETESPIFKLHPREQNILFYILGYVPMFVNAALNPVILICRGENLREHLRQLLGRPVIQNPNFLLENRIALPAGSGGRHPAPEPPATVPSVAVPPAPQI